MPAIIIAFVVSALDQWSKHRVRAGLRVNDPVEIIEGFFNLTYVRNTGAVWGILQEHGLVLVVFSFVVMIALAFFYRRIVAQNKFYSIALGLMLGGITGNLIDRIRVGWVTDFFDFYLYRFHWPAFNVADAAICAGVFVYALLSFTGWHDEDPAQTDANGICPEK